MLYGVSTPGVLITGVAHALNRLSDANGEFGPTFSL